MAVNLAFHECLLDPRLFSTEGGSPAPVIGGPEYANSVLRNRQSGVIKVAVLRFDPKERLTFDLSLMSPEDVSYLINFIRGGFGSGIGFRVKVPHDYKTELEAFAGPGGTQVPNGVLTAFNLVKTYVRPGITSHEDVRRIIKPVHVGAKATGASLKDPDGQDTRGTDSINMEIPFQIFFDTGAGDVEQTTGWTVNVTTGVVTFTTPPATGTTIRWSGTFDTPMMFTDNQFNIRADVVGNAQSIGLEEILPATLGIT